MKVNVQRWWSLRRALLAFESSRQQKKSFTLSSLLGSSFKSLWDSFSHWRKLCTSSVSEKKKRFEDQVWGSARQRRTRLTFYRYTENPTLNEEEIHSNSPLFCNWIWSVVIFIHSKNFTSNFSDQTTTHLHRTGFQNVISLTPLS